MAYDVDYVWQDGLLTHQNMIYYLRITSKNETRVVKIPFSAKFVYDESNTPVGCLVNDEAAVGFVRNLQGDIIATVTHEGDVLAEYSYDPWGKVTVTCDGEEFEGMEAALMALYCPFAYRGYNYDYTTGLYYLQSRYYNPEWGRFLNVDDTNILLSTQGENLGANLFAYCNNNPVNKVDYNGRNSQAIFAAKLAVLLAVIVAIDMACRDDLYNIFPTFNYLNIDERKIEKSLIFLDLSYIIRSNNNATIILLKATLQTEVGIKYFEGIMEIRTRSEWEYISWGGDFTKALAGFDNEFYAVTAVLPDLLSPERAFAVNSFEFVRSVLEETSRNSKRGAFIRNELQEQKAKYNSDMACILSWYCTYQKRNFFGKILKVNYIEHDRAKEYRR